MKKLLYLTIGTLLIYSCSKEDIASKSSPVAPSETEVATTDGMTVLGKQLENPYSVNNMRRHWQIWLRQHDPALVKIRFKQRITT